MTLDHGYHNNSGKKRKRRDSDSASSNAIESSFSSLQMNTLRRYKRCFKLQTRPGLNKVQLSEAVVKHFKAIPVIEKEALAYFIYMVKNNKNRIDNEAKENANYSINGESNRNNSNN